MNLLTPYQKNDFKLSVLAAAVFSHETQSLFVKFELQDPKSVVEYAVSNSKIIDRRDELWKKTCFEIFLQPSDQEKYFEINMSTEGYWNAYEFEKYRTPQPPQFTSIIDLKQYNWNSEKRTLTAELIIKDSTNHWNMGLAAVLKSKIQNETYYFALKHRPDKADFHWPESFCLQKGR